MIEPSHTIVLGAIQSGKKSFKDIQKIANIPSQKLTEILDELKRREMIKMEIKKKWFSKSTEITITESGKKTLNEQIADMKDKWSKMIDAYKSGDGNRMSKIMDGYRSFLPMMKIFGIVDMATLKMMLSMVDDMIVDNEEYENMKNRHDEEGDEEYDDEEGDEEYDDDRDGYDEEGYDENGYDRDGYDEEGYDENGYDRDGYDEEDHSADGRRNDA